MSSKINIEQLEGYLKKAGVENGELENILQPIKELNNQRQYGLVWEEPDNTTYGTDSAEQELLRNFPFLKEVNEHRIFNGEGNPDHLLIEGDNLHALKTMQYTHKNKIDVIYIDPPYNTGNTDFVYNDKYVDNEDSWRHSKWLSFMNKRLRLARELMTDEGVIFISIDDNELYQLKLLCDQIFGEENFVANMVRKENAKMQKIGKPNIKTEHEYVLVYKKDKIGMEYVSNKEYKEYERNAKRLLKELEKVSGEPYLDYYKMVRTDKIPYNKKQATILRNMYQIQGGLRGLRQYRYIDETGLYRESDISMYLGRGNDYHFINPNTGNKVRQPKNGMPPKEKLMDTGDFIENEEGDLEVVDVDKVVKIAEGKFSYSNIVFKEGNIIGYKKYLDTETVPNTILIEYMGSDDKLMQNMSLNFSYPKRANLVKYLIALHENKNATVLDFFAGSGTTAHAVMELNKEDGGNRQAIVITNNEINSTEEEDLLVEKDYVEPFTGSRRGTKKHAEWLEKVNEFKQTPEYLEFIETDEYKDLGIARAVTEQRINKVINGYTTPKNKEVEGLTDNNFYHFEIKLEPDLMDMDLNTYVLVNKTKDIIRIKEGVYTKEEDISTETVPSVKLTGKDKEVIVVLSVRVTETDIEQLINNFKYSEKEHVIYTSYTGFEYGINNIRFEELPKELLQAIKHDENN